MLYKCLFVIKKLLHDPKSRHFVDQLKNVNIHSYTFNMFGEATPAPPHPYSLGMGVSVSINSDLYVFIQQ